MAAWRDSTGSSWNPNSDKALADAIMRASHVTTDRRKKVRRTKSMSRGSW